MTTKHHMQFSLDDCSCMEMMSHMMSQEKGQQWVGDACAEMMPQFIDPQGSNEFLEMMSEMATSCWWTCSFSQETKDCDYPPNHPTG